MDAEGVFLDESSGGGGKEVVLRLVNRAVADSFHVWGLEFSSAMADG